MRALQPILDVLERAENPRQRAVDVSTRKPAVQDMPSAVFAMRRFGILNTPDEFQRQQFMQQMMAQQQNTTTTSANGLGSLLGRGLF